MIAGGEVSSQARRGEIGNECLARSRIWATSATVLIGMTLAWTFNLVNGLVLGRPWPFNSFLFIPGDRFADYTNILAAQAHQNPYSSPLMVYFPFTNVMLRPFTSLTASGGILMLCALLAVSTLVLFLRCTSQLESIAERVVVALIFLASYPVLFVGDRANVEIFSYALLVGFVLCWARGQRGAATVLLSAAIAAKGTAWIFLALLLPRRHRHHLVACLGLVALETLVGLLVLKPSLATSTSGLVSNLAYYNRTYGIGDAGYLFGHSLFGAAKAVVTLLLGDEERRAFSSAAFRPFAATGLALYVAAMVYVVRKKLDLWKAMTVLTCVSLLATPVSNDYRLLLLLLPCALFFAHPLPVANGRLVGVLFGLALVPKGFHLLFWSHSPSVSPNLSAVLSPIAILALLVAVLWNHDEPEAQALKEVGATSDGGFGAGLTRQRPGDGRATEVGFGPVMAAPCRDEPSGGGYG